MRTTTSASRTAAFAAMLTVTLVVLGATVHGVGAQAFPSKPVRVIIGPSPDAVPRVVAPQLQEMWKQPIVIDSRPGAGGQIAATAVASAAPDGHTLLFATPSYTLNTALKTANYDVVKDFAPAVLIGTGAYTLVVHPSVQARSVAELIALAKERPGKLNCASAGIGTAPHLACENFNTIPGVKVVHVPYRNVNEAMTAVIAGHVDMFVAVSLVAKKQMEAGAVRGIATTGDKRTMLIPELPTIAESGYPDFVLTGWNGFLSAAKTPRPILEKINADVREAMQHPPTRERLVVIGQEFLDLDVDGFTKFVAEDVARWTRMVERIGRDKLAPESERQR
jgi:tripartite-type tricarboxylate transporter receptor subunit TctC